MEVEGRSVEVEGLSEWMNCEDQGCGWERGEG